MVFERLYTPEFLNKNKFIILILSITFTITGIAGSFLFESNHATISLAITSLILYASLKDVFSLNAAKAKKTCSRAALAKEYLSLLSIFFYIFLGVLIVFSLCSILLFQKPIQPHLNNEHPRDIPIGQRAINIPKQPHRALCLLCHCIPLWHWSHVPLHRRVERICRGSCLWRCC